MAIPLLFHELLLRVESVFVNGRSRPVIMEDMQRRIERGDITQEKQDAIKVCFEETID